MWTCARLLFSISSLKFHIERKNQRAVRQSSAGSLWLQGVLYSCHWSCLLTQWKQRRAYCVMMWTVFLGFTFSCCRSISAETHNLFCALWFYLFRGNESMNAAKRSVLTKMMWMPFPVSPPTTVWIINLLLRLLHSLSQRQRTHTAFKMWRRDARTHVHITADQCFCSCTRGSYGLNFARQHVHLSQCCIIDGSNYVILKHMDGSLRVYFTTRRCIKEERLRKYTLDYVHYFNYVSGQ